MDRTVLEAVAQFGRSQLTFRHHCFIGLLHLCTRLLVAGVFWGDFGKSYFTTNKITSKFGEVLGFLVR